jgi:hypothetical protein
MEINMNNEKNSTFNIYKEQQRYSSKPQTKLKKKQILRSFQGNFLNKKLKPEDEITKNKKMIYYLSTESNNPIQDESNLIKTQKQFINKKPIKVPKQITSKKIHLKNKNFQKHGRKLIYHKMKNKKNHLQKSMFNQTQPIQLKQNLNLTHDDHPNQYTSNINNAQSRGYISIYSTQKSNKNRVNSLKQICSNKNMKKTLLLQNPPKVKAKASLRTIKLGEPGKPSFTHFHTTKYLPAKKKMFKSSQKKHNLPVKSLLIKQSESPYQFNTQYDLSPSESFNPSNYLNLKINQQMNKNKRKFKSKLRKKNKKNIMKVRSTKPKKVFVPQSFLNNSPNTFKNKQLINMFFKENQPRKLKIHIHDKHAESSLTIGKPKKIQNLSKKVNRKIHKAKQFRPFDFKNQKKTSIFYKEHEQNRNKPKSKPYFD